MISFDRVLGQVYMDCMRMRKRVLRMVGTKVIVSASWLMDLVVDTRQFRESDAFGKGQKTIGEKMLEDWRNIRFKMKAKKIKNARRGSASGEAQDGESSACRC